MGWKNKEAERAYHRRYYHKRMAHMREMLGNKCQICDWDEFPEILEFAHKHGTTKNLCIGNCTQKKWEVTCAELEKCLLLCPTCHRLYDKYGEPQRWRAYCSRKA